MRLPTKDSKSKSKHRHANKFVITLSEYDAHLPPIYATIKN